MKFCVIHLAFVFVTLFSAVSFAGETQANSTRSPSEKTPGTFTLGNKEFLLDGKPFLIRAGEIHYPRIPREYWEHRIQMCKAMGMNTICIYVFWNWHEPEPDRFDFTGSRDVAEFIRLVQKNGMYAIVRPGPYSCAEWEMGGFPWWLLKKSDLQVRTHKDQFFLDRAKKFLLEIGKQLAPLQIQNGGPILMVQVENEYGAWGRDEGYMTAIRDAIRESGFDKVQLFRCDWSSNFNNYKVDDVAVTLNFGAGSNIEEMFRKFNKLYPTAPRMCSEYWTGWFDHWGRRHETRSVKSFIGSYKDMLDRRISVSLYMAHGGTSFGHWGGASSGYMVTSYDYNAPIDEAGHATEKFYAVRNLLKNYLNPGESIPEIPAEIPMISISPVTLKEVAPLFANLPAAKNSSTIKPMEMFDQGWGRIVYSTQFPKDVASGAKLEIRNVCDWALVFINGKRVGKLDRRLRDSSISLPAIKANDKLDILVEAMGRENYGGAIIDRKGITHSVKLLDRNSDTLLKDWKIYNIDVDYPVKSELKYSLTPTEGPAWYRGTFTLDQLGDTHLDVSSWGKGMVWVNGHNLGRYWNLGPQQTLYLPGCWLKKGVNEIIVLDLEKPKTPVVSGTTTPILDQLNPDTSLLNRKPGQNLRLDGETVSAEGKLTAGSDWQTVEFASPVKGRYFCLETVSPLRQGDPDTSLAELELLGPSGEKLSRSQWRILFADSEEILAGNHTADKLVDKQESTFWHSQWSNKPQNKYPHAVVIDLGEEVTVSGIMLLPRGDQNKNGMFKEFRIYLKSNPFTY